MSRTTNNVKPKTSRLGRAQASRLGSELRRISDKFFASGGKPLTRTEIEREVAQRRGSR